MKLKKIVGALITATSAQYACATTLDTVYVSNNLVVDNALTTPYSTTQFTQADIRNSGATNLPDFLNQNTSMMISSNFGNPLSPRIDLGGYGAETGYENVQIIVNGVSLKNIDLVPSQLNAISLSSIKNISILQGSGSVKYGNGSGGGAIVIDTFQGADIQPGAQFSTKHSSDSRRAQSVNIQHSENISGYQAFANFNLQTEGSDGQKKVKSDGTRNTLDHHQLSTHFGVTKDKTTADLSFSNSSSEINYPGNLSLADYRDDPDQDQTNGSTQETDEKTSQFHIGHEFDNTKVDFIWSTRNKDSEIFSLYHYNQSTQQLDLKSRFDDVVLSYGYKQDQSKRANGDVKFEIDSAAVYTSADFQASEVVTLNAGLRLEQMDYHYKDTGNKLSEDENLKAYNLGANYKLNENSALYANFNRAYNSPAIDRYFKWNGTFTSQEFNGFIDTQLSDTLTVGYKNQLENTQYTVELFASKLENELFLDKYLDPFGFGINTNIDESSKHGLNIKAKQFYDLAIIGVDYRYQDARIDKNDDTDLKGKKVPGVSDHAINLFAEVPFNATWFSALPEHRLNVSHKAATASYALSDYQNEYGKYPAFNSTDLTYTMANKTVSVKLGINNLFDRDNATYVYKGNAPKGIVVYPETNDRSWFIQFDAKI